MHEHAEKKGLISQPRRLLISNLEVTMGTLIFPLLLIYLELGLVFTKISRFVEYTPVKCFNNFVQTAVNCGCQTEESPNSSVFAGTMKLSSNSS